MIKSAKGTERNLEDIKLTRYAGYLIAMSGDPRKSEIAFAQNYFAVQTRKFERIVERMNELERIDSRERLKESEKLFGRVIYERGVKDKFGYIKAIGDKAFFGGKTTKEMKEIVHAGKGRPLADYTNTAVNLGRSLAQTITTMNVQKEDLFGARDIGDEHVKSNKNVRESLTNSGIYPEKLPPEEDINKVKRKITSEEKKIAKDNKGKKA